METLDWREVRDKVRTVVESKLSHADSCDEGFTQGICARCDILASLEVTFGFAAPLDKSPAIEPVVCRTCGSIKTVWDVADGWSCTSCGRSDSDE